MFASTAESTISRSTAGRSAPASTCGGTTFAPFTNTGRPLTTNVNDWAPPASLWRSSATVRRPIRRCHTLLGSSRACTVRSYSGWSPMPLGHHNCGCSTVNVCSPVATSWPSNVNRERIGTSAVRFSVTRPLAWTWRTPTNSIRRAGPASMRAGRYRPRVTSDGEKSHPYSVVCFRANSRGPGTAKATRSSLPRAFSSGLASNR